MNKHVAILVQNLPVPFDRRVWLEATTLRDAGYDVSVICPTSAKYAKHSETLEDVHIYRYDLPQTTDSALSYLKEYAVSMAWSFWLLWKLFRNKRIDIIHACNPPDLFVFLALPFKVLFGTKFLYDQHDLCPELYQAKSGKQQSFFYSALRLAEYITLKVADQVIVTNESTRRIAVERGGLSIENVTIVRTGPDQERLFKVAPQQTLKRGKTHLVVYLGVMGQQDGVDYALQAIAHLQKSPSPVDAHFVFIGDGEHRSKLVQLTMELDISRQVEFTGRISDEDLRVYLSTASLGLSPDPKNGFNELHTMNKTMEYMAMGVPVVAFDLDETRFSAGDAAYYAQPNCSISFAFQIKQLLAAIDKRIYMGKLGQERVRTKLGWEHSCRALVRTYSKIIGSTYQ